MDDPAAATGHAAGALGALRRLGAAGEAAAAAALLGRLGVTPMCRALFPALLEKKAAGASAGRSPARPACSRTARREVLDLVADGLSNPEIAERLFLSRKTGWRIT